MRLDQKLRSRYEISKLILDSWNDGFEVATQVPVLPYTGIYVPSREGIDRESVQARQHLVRGQLELALDALTMWDGRRWRCLELVEVNDAWGQRRTPLRERLRRLEELVVSFTPKRRPVLWRLLLCQAILHSIVADPDRLGSLSTTIGDRKEQERFDWRAPADHADVSFEQAVEEPLEAARSHLLALAERGFARAGG